MINLIYARDRSHGIGKNNVMPWHVPEDFKYFKHMTAGETIVMGRKTWDSLPLKPLPYRRNVVLSRHEREDVETVNSLEELKALAHERVVWVIGGAELFSAMVTDATYVSESVIPGKYDCDTFVKPLPLLDFEFVQRQILSCANGMSVFTALYRNVTKPSDPAFENELRRRAIQSQSKAKA